MPQKTERPTANSTGPRGRNRGDPKDALKLVKPGGRAGYVSADKVLVSFEDGSKGVYWATPAERRKRIAASKSKAEAKSQKKGTRKKAAKKNGKKGGRKKAIASRAGRSKRRVPGTPNLRDLSNEQLISIRKDIDGEISSRIAAAERELGSLKKIAT